MFSASGAFRRLSRDFFAGDATCLRISCLKLGFSSLVDAIESLDKLGFGKQHEFLPLPFLKYFPAESLATCSVIPVHSFKFCYVRFGNLVALPMQSACLLMLYVAQLRQQ